MRPVLIGSLIAGIAGLAWRSRWIQDDAFITFVYSKHLASGLGPVWNPGQRVEGYTNFLWMLLIALAEKIGINPETFVSIAGVAFFAVSLTVVYKLTHLLTDSRSWSLLSVLFAGTNYSCLMYATGGLETSLASALILTMIWITCRCASEGDTRPRDALALSILSALAIMTRPDSIIAVVVSLTFAATFVIRSHIYSRAVRLTRLVYLFIPLITVLSAWVLWKLTYYGAALPNTVNVKVSGSPIKRVIRGLIYVAWPPITYWWLPVSVALLFAYWKNRRLSEAPLSRKQGPRRLSREKLLQPIMPLVFFILLWLPYIISLGGDFMEFRLLVPAITITLIILTVAASHVLTTQVQMSILALVLVAGSLSHAIFSGYYIRPRGIYPIAELRSNVSGAATSWRSIGTQLRNQLGSDSDVRIAVTPAGAIPFFSGLFSIDMIGLNDRWIAQNGHVNKKCFVCTGHTKMAPISYLQYQDINLVFGHPQIVAWDYPIHNIAAITSGIFLGENMDFENLPAEVVFVRMPLTEDQSVVSIYLNRSSEIDALLATGKWRSQEVPRERLQAVLRQRGAG